MTIEIRSGTEDDLGNVIATDGRNFGSHFTASAHADVQLLFEPERYRLAFDGDELVGVVGAQSFLLTVPGGGSVPATGVTWVSVAATHRRRGILTQLMAAQREESIAHGDVVSILTASEAAIYGRFGYGCATRCRRITVETPRVEFRSDVPDTGRCRFVDATQARALLPEIYEQTRSQRAGRLTRSDNWWTFQCNDGEWRRDGLGPLHHVVHYDDAGVADGFVSYRIAHKWDPGKPSSTLHLADLVSTNWEAEANLWRYLCGVDLVTRIQTPHCPLDHPLTWWLLDPRAVSTTSWIDEIWLRIEDLVAALEARTYHVDGELVVSLTDGGCWHIAQSNGVATVEATSQPPDLLMSSTDLGALYLAGVKPSSLVAAGRIGEPRPGTAKFADVFFGDSREPHLSQSF